MQDFLPEINSQIRIDGIKVTAGLVLFNLCLPRPTVRAFLLPAMAEEKINVCFLTRMETDAGAVCSWCVSATDMHRVECLLDEAASRGEQVEVIRPVAAVSIFPHRHHLAVPVLAVNGFREDQIPVHALGTSLSSVVIVTSEHLVSRAINAMARVFNLPANQIPGVADSPGHPQDR